MVRASAVSLGLAGLLAGGLGAGFAQAQYAAAGTPNAAPAADTALSSMLRLNREEERMARDLYAAIADLHDGARPFSMITRSEQHHWQAVGRLLENHDIADPSAGRATGSYADPALQTRYDNWLADAKTSLTAAYQVGVELEQRNIADLEKAIAASPHSDVDAVLGNLLTASRRHLAAFQNAASGDPASGNGPGRGLGIMDGPGPGAGPGSAGGNGPGNGPGRHGGMGRTDGVPAGTNTCPYATS
jgi:hypothetical protein